MKTFKKRNLILPLAFLFSTAASALQPIPDMTGVTGFVTLGAGAASVESNFLAEAVGQDLGDSNISTLGSPDSESTALPVVAFELSYVFDGKTQLFVGNLIEDYLRFDFATRLGVRHSLGDAGRVGLSLLQTPITTDVWENPYATGVDRDATERDSTGFRVSWDKILGTGLEVRVSSRETEIDDEQSGVGLGLTNAQIASLDREGDVDRINIRYLLLNSDTSQLIAGVTSTDADLDGEAMSYDGTSLEFNWIYTPNKDLKVVSNFLIASREYDADHPVFGEKADSDLYALSVTGFFPGMFGFKDWTPNAGLVIGRESSDIDFFDSEVSIVTFGFLHRF